MDRCIIHEWQPRGEVSVCMSCGAELDRPVATPHISAKQRRAAAMKRHREQRQAYRTKVTEVIVYRPRPASPIKPIG